jgi:GNAT superfamily N-acetyltransferase
MAVRLTSSSFTADSLYEMNRDAMREHIEAARGESWNEDREAKQFHLQLRKDYVEAIERDGSAIGFIDLRRERIHLFLHTMVVLSHVQGQGTGGIVLEQIKERAQNLTKGVRLSVLKANPMARRFYERNGFIQESSTTSHDQLSVSQGVKFGRCAKA